MTTKPTATSKITENEPSTALVSNAHAHRGLPNAPKASTVLVNVPVPIDLHRRLRIAAITRGLTLKDATLAALEAWVAE